MPDSPHYQRFDEVADLYDRVRPAYPDALFEVLTQVCGLHEGAQVLEIGPGTGQATVSLARRAFRLVAVERGPTLAEIARRNLKPYPEAHVLTAAFESAPLPHGSFDLVVAATAFHWLDPASRFQRCHHLLKPGGFLAIIHAEPVSGPSGNRFVEASQPVYRRFSNRPDADPFVPPAVRELRGAAIDPCLFEACCFQVFPFDTEHTARDYVDLLRTFSTTHAMAPDAREEFLKAIAALINGAFGGLIVRHLAATLTIARKREIGGET